MARTRPQQEKGEVKTRGQSRAGASDRLEEKGAGGSDQDHGRPNNSLREWIRSLAVAVVLFLIIRTFLLSTFVIISGSMERTLLVGDLLLVNRLATGSRVPGTSLRIPGYSSPHRGDVLVFDPPHEEGMLLVKRLVGLPGDTLEMRNRELFLDGQPLPEPDLQHEGNGEDFTDPIMTWQRQYLLPGTPIDSYRPTRDEWGPIVIPEGRYFMLGDNRDSSYDSRYWGLLEGWRLEGRAVLIYFSYDKESLRAFPWLREIRWGRIGDRIR
jgi:signal peptidase I